MTGEEFGRVARVLSNASVVSTIIVATLLPKVIVVTV
jgi:hypothetical protein